MQVKRFVAADMRRALEMVRQELGSDAIILSSSRTKEGVELLTTHARPEMPDLPPERSNEPEPSSADWAVDSPSMSAGEARAQAIEQARRRQLAQKELDDSAREYLKPNQTVNAGIPLRQPGTHTQQAASNAGLESASRRRPQTAAERYPLADLSESPSQLHSHERQPRLHELQEELAEMRLLLEGQLAQVRGGRGPARPPVLATIGRRLERMGLSGSLVDHLVSHLDTRKGLSEAWSGALAGLTQQLPVDASDPVAKGGVYALLGPTGAGKTTSIGKLAARFVLQQGSPRNLALVTLDTHRIGGHDQLRSMARILGADFKVVESANSLDGVLYSLRRHRLVLIDTAGFRPGDERLAAQLRTLEQQPGVHNLLVLPGNSQERVLKASVHAYGAAGLSGCLVTKLDESTSLGEVLGVAIQGRLPIVYTTDGQDIPKDMAVARAHQLVAKSAALVKQREPRDSEIGAGVRGRSGPRKAQAV